MDKKRLYEYDFLRVMAFLMIVMYHINATGIASFSMPFLSSGELGAIGVGIYIMLSGFLLSYHYNGGVKSFYKKRIISIMVPFWTAYIMVLLVKCIFIKDIGGWSWGDRPAISFLLTVFGMDGYLLYKIPNYYLLGEWFLGLIIIYYIAFPFLYRLAQRFPKSLLLVTIGIFLYVIQHYIWEMSIIRNPIVLLPFFVIGILANSYIGKDLDFFISIFFFCFLFNHISLYDSCIGILVKTIIIFYAYLMAGKFVANSVIAQKIFEKLSYYSYGMFLFHHVIIYYFESRFFLNTEKVDSITAIVMLFVVCILSLLFSFVMDEVIKFIKQIKGKVNEK